MDHVDVFRTGVSFESPAKLPQLGINPAKDGLPSAFGSTTTSRSSKNSYGRLFSNCSGVD